MEVKRKILRDMEGVVWDLLNDIDRIVPKLLIFWLGAASAVVFFLPEIIGLAKITPDAPSVLTKRRFTPAMPVISTVCTANKLQTFADASIAIAANLTPDCAFAGSPSLLAKRENPWALILWRGFARQGIARSCAPP